MYKSNTQCPKSHQASTYLLCGSVYVFHVPQLVCGNSQYLYVHAMCHVVYMTHGMHRHIHFNLNRGMVTSWPPYRKERHCNWPHTVHDTVCEISNCADIRVELQTEVDNLHRLLYRQAGLSCPWGKENKALASVGLTALAITVFPLPGTRNKFHALVTGFGLQVVSQALHV